MSTPIYDALKTEARTRKAIIQPPEDDPLWKLQMRSLTFKPEPKWRPFVRCLGWWKR